LFPFRRLSGRFLKSWNRLKARVWTSLPPPPANSQLRCKNLPGARLGHSKDMFQFREVLQLRFLPWSQSVQLRQFQQLQRAFLRRSRRLEINDSLGRGSAE